MKIYITGPAGSGKSTLAEKLGTYYSTPVVHLDQLQWDKNWKEKENYHDSQKEAIAGESWIIEWSSCSIVNEMQELDAVIILEYPPIGNIWRICKRYLKTKIFKEKRVGVASPEKFNIFLLYKTWIWKKRQFPRLFANIKKNHFTQKIQIRTDFSTSFEESILFLSRL